MRASLWIVLIVGCGHDQTPETAVDAAPDTTTPTAVNVIVGVGSTGRALPVGFSGFNYDGQETALRYSDPQAKGLLDSLDAGFVRFPGGSTGNAHNWENGDMASTLVPFPYPGPSDWVSYVEGHESTPGQIAIEDAEQRNMGKGYSPFSEFVQLAGTRPVIITVNAFTDTVQHVGQLAAAACGPGGVNVVFFELANEPYFYSGPSGQWATGAAYATAMQPYRTAISTNCPGKPISMFFTDRDSTWNSGPTGHPAQGLFAASAGFDDIATHVYPVASTANCGDCALDQVVGFYNGVLASGTNSFIDSYFVAQKPNATIEITEMNLGSGAGRTFLADTIYQAIFLTEYIARLSSDEHVSYAGVHQVYQTGDANGSMMVASDDHLKPIMDAAAGSGPANTIGLDFGFSISVPGEGLLLLDAAVNSNTTALVTTTTDGSLGSATVAASGTDATTAPALFAQAYGSPPSTARSVVLTNKGALAQLVELDDGGTAVTSTMTLSQLAGGLVNDSNPLMSAAMPASNPVTVPPFSIVRVDYN